MPFDNAYEALADAHDDARWAYGTGFADPLASVPADVPDGVSRPELARLCVALGDDALVMSHRLQQWCTNAPELEDEVALANIGLDLLGQARWLYTRAGAVDGTGRSEDDFAFLRSESEFLNVRLVELPNGDFAELVARLLVFSTWRLAVLTRLVSYVDPVVAAIAAKGVKEVTYHRDYAARWCVRLGDGTAYSRERMRAGLDTVWPFVWELFDRAEPDLRVEFDEVLGRVLSAATLAVPTVADRADVLGKVGRDGVHTEAMGYLIADLQSVARANPGAVW
ncbi:1,2-phenylacetyl-CoA epoxidase subunit PaaC [Tenggerimyces flavus]|uniref:1,2-phenylacetyl-CoA epoxidase subunit PaaC n=1 Tax=Tenggerimyces flavus TaxID=1708749 RepID=A0ABV7YFU8_9ACTN|nr:1,2-phenylacetyl-CoA epoxidase subunit PaaC [Tenggerimyces flavus]MBM7784004.1 ring-1,2-phenylacetyl-CoA epoxidase subunit PaaC [Tenggerimyces flavus]